MMNNTVMNAGKDQVRRSAETGRMVAEHVRDSGDEQSRKNMIEAASTLVDSTLTIDRAYAHAVLSVFGVNP